MESSVPIAKSLETNSLKPRSWASLQSHFGQASKAISKFVRCCKKVEAIADCPKFEKILGREPSTTRRPVVTARTRMALMVLHLATQNVEHRRFSASVEAKVEIMKDHIGLLKAKQRLQQ
ncbi:hypothetical protein GQ600_27359 [Phytophthora cactorum]|nr:hypothetical protein GQ600_27359 [Phytophthora cactorum]